MENNDPARRVINSLGTVATSTFSFCLYLLVIVSSQLILISQRDEGKAEIRRQKAENEAVKPKPKPKSVNPFILLPLSFCLGLPFPFN